MPPLRYHRGLPLTPRETEVAGLVAQGLNNSEIAKLLVVTNATVKAHCTHIYRKLGFANRLELAVHWKDKPPIPPTS